MLKIENAEVVGWEHAIRGMRNPMNSWGKSDSRYYSCIEANRKAGDTLCKDCGSIDSTEYCVGPNDQKLMTQLAKAGTDHRKFMRMITVYLDITAPLYWWKEFDTYKVEFTLDDFSCEHLVGIAKDDLNGTLAVLNHFRKFYLKTKEKSFWWQMIQLLPSSYNQKRTVMLNYEVLANIYKSRRNHKLDEWHTLCDWIERLPLSEIITGKER